MFFTSKLAPLATFAALSLAVIPVVRSAVIQVTVGGTGIIAYTPSSVEAQVGDVIQFIFKQKNHTITQSSLESPCSPLPGGFDSGFIPVAADETDFRLAKLEVVDTKPVWIYCRQAGHCQQGMVFAVNPGDKLAAFQAAATGGAAPSTPPPSSTASSPSPSSTSTDHVIVVGGPAGLVYTPSNIQAQPGDTVTFQFHEKNHTVTASSFAQPCRALSLTSTTGQAGFDSGFMAVDAAATTFPTYTIQINDTQPIWGYCRQQQPAGHCGQGMVFSINAVESGPNNFAAFQAKAIQLNGTNSGSAPPPSNSDSADKPSGASTLHSRSAAVMVVVLGAVAGLLL